MTVTKEGDLKQLVCETADECRNRIVELGRPIPGNPELGFKEAMTRKLVALLSQNGLYLLCRAGTCSGPFPSSRVFNLMSEAATIHVC